MNEGRYEGDNGKRNTKKTRKMRVKERSCPKAVIELSGGWEGSTPSSFFNPPACSQKLPGGQAKPPRAALNSSMYLALCLHQKISNMCELQDDPIIRGPRL